MSRWHAIDGTIFGDGADGVTLEFWPLVPTAPFTTQLADQLSDPSVDTIAPSAWSLLPKGPAWGTPDGMALATTSVLARFWRAVSDGFSSAYADGWRVTMESTTATLVASLSDWETEFGLPDPCVGVFQGEGKRLNWLQEKVRSVGVITPGDFLNLAERLGYGVVIEEPVIFEAGCSELGGPDETGTPDGNHLVVFWILGAGEYGFEAGIGEAGFTPLYDFDQATAIECRFRELLPAGFKPLFDYSELSTFSGWPEAWPSAWE